MGNGGASQLEGMLGLNEKILNLAREMVSASEADEPLLAALCGAAESAWTRRLHSGLTPADCEDVFCCAAALTAAADFIIGSDAGGGSGFTAGVVSVQTRNGNDQMKWADALRQTAERLMKPFAVPENVWFKGVRG